MLAIIVPFFKLTFFDETLSSLANQTDKRFKVYIGDDASPEDCKFLLNQYKGKVDFDYFRFEDNLGSKSLVQQWYRCLHLLNNESWVLILGDDDVLDLNVIASFYENKLDIENAGSFIVRYATQVIDKEGVKMSRVYTHPALENSFDFLFRRLNGETRSSLSEYIFQRDEVLKIGIKDLPLAWFSDLLLVVELSLEKPIYSINESLVFFRNSGINISSKRDNLIQKNKATFYFYFYLIQNYKVIIPINLMDLLYAKLENTVINNKKNITMWQSILSLYITNGKTFQFIHLILKAVKKVF